jgi:hypothetical protein
LILSGLITYVICIIEKVHWVYFTLFQLNHSCHLFFYIIYILY